MFEDRADAGKQLGKALKTCDIKKPLVLGIPRGGVEVAYHVAKVLSASLSIIIVRKLPFPDNPEAGFGAVAEDGTVYMAPGSSRWFPQSTVDRIIREQKREVRHRINTLRNGKPLPDLRGREVILVDDGIAMGSTTTAASMCCRTQNSSRILAATPAASPRAVENLQTVADRVIALFAPPGFRAVAEFYRNWYDVSDEEALGIIEQARQDRLIED
ncbi:MAG: phosphoribosyltransferase [Verrucomicrobiota bacterium]